MSTTPNEEEEEVLIHWTDDAIRELVDHGNNKNDDDDDDTEGAFIDPFAVDPHETFDFTFTKNEAVIDIILEGYNADADQVWKSTGLTIWRAAELTCDYLVEHSASLLRNKNRILELGAGLGLCGILAYHLLVLMEEGESEGVAGAEVFLTDGDVEAIVALKHNVSSNTDQQQQSKTKIACKQLLWGKELSETFLQQQNNNEKTDLLIASDIVYSPLVVQPLWETVATLLSEDGQFLFGYCSRRDVKITIEEVLETAKEYGFEWDCVDDRDGVLVYVFQWKK
mmetsp:Transcript_3082/g.4724  ORF Transcript_3082/g.4724 Transcript_3082/m.4724 type:complete len:282 (-) Transcript_3082:236-1081(-)